MYFSGKDNFNVIYLYSALIYIAGFILKIVALFNKKISLFVNGRKSVFKTLEKNINSSDKVIWFHAASLGEFEQGLPVIEQTKKQFQNHKILVTFFSPSGYEIKKNHPVADFTSYLPLDTPINARRFLEIVHPEFAIFIKYEFWPNYLRHLKKNRIKTILISAIFNKKQIFFKPHGVFMRKTLRTFDHFFVQDEDSKNLLNRIHFNNVSVSGDTRFDRVNEIINRDNSIFFIKEFKTDNMCFVAGSTWKADEDLIVSYINESSHDSIKYIIAPHNIKPNQIDRLKTNINKKVVLFSEMDRVNLSDYAVFIADTIGILTKIYSYADVAYVGGGMGNSGLHNTLEPAVFGIPVIIGKNYAGFKEAEDLVKLGGILSVQDQKTFNKVADKLIMDESYQKETGEICKNYISKNTGATSQIIKHLIAK